MSSEQWEAFVGQLDNQQQQMLSLKQAHKSDPEIAKALNCTPKQMQKRWTGLLEMAWKTRNSAGDSEALLRSPLALPLAKRGEAQASADRSLSEDGE
jgi:hypothetical protein